MTHKISSHLGRCRGALAVLIMLGSSAALAQWQWVDDTGRKVFSDRPPPSSVNEKNILKRPAAPVPAAPSAAPSGGEAEAAPGSAPAPTGRDEQLESRKKQAAQAQQNANREQEARQAKQRAESCEQAKRAKVTLDSGMRIATTNAKGEREIMDEAARAAEARRVDEMIRAACNPAPTPQR